ncbi:MAG: protein phosphatase 2C domain-containing protein [Terracidiphilus sp.]|jgi:protein phosphatase
MSKVAVSGQAVIAFAEECNRGALRHENLNSVLHVHIELGELMIVADGAGESTGGSVASRMVVEHFYAHLAALPRDYAAENAIREAAARANASILAANRAPGSPYQRLGSTVVVALLQQSGDLTNAWIGHIGDSRAYLLRAGRLNCITTDHSAVQALLHRGLINPNEIENHPDSSVLTRSLGHQPVVDIEVEQLPLAVGDTLLLCSDGLWKFVPEQNIETALGSVTVESAAHNLLEMALIAGGQDDIGIELARVISPPDNTASQRAHTHPAIKVLFALFLLILACLCILSYLTFWAR